VVKIKSEMKKARSKTENKKKRKKGKVSLKAAIY
jgi:hypothetical protein